MFEVKVFGKQLLVHNAFVQEAVRKKFSEENRNVIRDFLRLMKRLPS